MRLLTLLLLALALISRLVLLGEERGPHPHQGSKRYFGDTGGYKCPACPTSSFDTEAELLNHIASCH